MSWTVFHTTPNPTGQELDDNLTALSRMGAFPCTVGGSANAITLAFADTNAPPLNAYPNYQEFSFIATATNNSAVTIKVGALATLNAYKDTPTGPVALSGAEIVLNCGYIAMYDLALNSGAGGFHVRASGTVANSPINPSQIQVASGASLTRFLSGLYTVTYTVVPANTSQDQNVIVAGALANDYVILGVQTGALATGLFFQGRIVAAGTVALRAANCTAASIAAFSLSPVHIGVMGATP